MAAPMMHPDNENDARSFLKLPSVFQGESPLMRGAFDVSFRSVIGGIVAGRVLLKLISWKIHEDSDYSQQKAIFLAANLAKIEKLSRKESYYGLNLPADLDYTRRHWYRFRPAILLWGAACLLAENGQFLEGDCVEQRYFKMASAVIELEKRARGLWMREIANAWSVQSEAFRDHLQLEIPTPNAREREIMVNYVATAR